ncbi:hypothetical protein [Sulfitobacter mediterraneus]|uniref:hypothetical protein n=1 Tax=Sulfitobacter mediterraneus TaxID=83219 RepID=UPI0021A6CC16|nr:hypothetical protein [Sulfitobacter mediterraneus]UWR13405.1 hypothetical protein K3753_19155 [Sulfitobacter mediterraneus]
MRSYETARSLFSFLEVMAWIMVVAGIIIAFGGASAASLFSRSSAGLMGALPGIVIAILGLFMVAQVQGNRATVDSAEFSQQMLKLTREHLEVSKQALKQGNSVAQSFAALPAPGESAPHAGFGTLATETKPSKQRETLANRELQNSSEGMPPPGSMRPADDTAIKYKGKEIVFSEGRYSFAKMSFSSLERAESYIDQLAVNPKAKV